MAQAKEDQEESPLRSIQKKSARSKSSQSKSKIIKKHKVEAPEEGDSEFEIQQMSKKGGREDQNRSIRSGLKSKSVRSQLQSFKGSQVGGRLATNRQSQADVFTPRGDDQSRIQSGKRKIVPKKTTKIAQPVFYQDNDDEIKIQLDRQSYSGSQNQDQDRIAKKLAKKQKKQPKQKSYIRTEQSSQSQSPDVHSKNQSDHSSVDQDDEDNIDAEQQQQQQFNQKRQQQQYESQISNQDYILKIGQFIKRRLIKFDFQVVNKRMNNQSNMLKQLIDRKIRSINQIVESRSQAQTDLVSNMQHEFEEEVKRRKRQKYDQILEINALGGRLAGMQRQINQMSAIIQSLVEFITIFFQSVAIDHALYEQDELDRKSIVLMGYKDNFSGVGASGGGGGGGGIGANRQSFSIQKQRNKTAYGKFQRNSNLQKSLPKLNSSSLMKKYSNPKNVISIDQNALHVGAGQMSSLVSAFKMASLAYNPSLVTYRSKQFERFQLIQIKGKILKDSWKSLQSSIPWKVPKTSIKRYFDQAVISLQQTTNIPNLADAATGHSLNPDSWLNNSFDTVTQFSHSPQNSKINAFQFNSNNPASNFSPMPPKASGGNLFSQQRLSNPGIKRPSINKTNRNYILQKTNMILNPSQANLISADLHNQRLAKQNILHNEFLSGNSTMRGISEQQIKNMSNRNVIQDAADIALPGIQGSNNHNNLSNSSNKLQQEPNNLLKNLKQDIREYGNNSTHIPVIQQQNSSYYDPNFSLGNQNAGVQRSTHGKNSLVLEKGRDSARSSSAGPNSFVNPIFQSKHNISNYENKVNIPPSRINTSTIYKDKKGVKFSSANKNVRNLPNAYGK